MKPPVLVTKRIYPEAIEFLKQHAEVDYVETDEGLTPAELIDYNMTRFVQFPMSRGMAELTKRTHVIQPGFVLEA